MAISLEWAAWFPKTHVEWLGDTQRGVNMRGTRKKSDGFEMFRPASHTMVEYQKLCHEKGYEDFLFSLSLGVG